jgi:hypothetical protein
MKAFYCFARSLAAGVVVLAVTGLATGARAGSGAPHMATVINLKGKVRFSNDNKTWQTLKKGAVLNPGSLIQTAEGGVVDVLLGEWGAKLTSPADAAGAPEEPSANVVRIFESSVLGIDKLTSDQPGTGDAEEIQLDLRSGMIMGSVKNMPGGSKYEIRIPKGVAGVRGVSRYTLSSSGAANVRMGSLVIAEAVADGSMVTQVVKAGHEFDPSTGQVSETPVDATIDVQPAKASPETKTKLPPSALGVAPGPLRKF